MTLSALGSFAGAIPALASTVSLPHLAKRCGAVAMGAAATMIASR